MENTDLSKSLINSIPLTSSTDLIKGYAEIGLDSIIENETLKTVHLVKTIVSIYGTIVSVRDRLLVKKLLEFLTNVNGVPIEKKDDFVRKMEEDPSYEKMSVSR